MGTKFIMVIFGSLFLMQIHVQADTEYNPIDHLSNRQTEIISWFRSMIDKGFVYSLGRLTTLSPFLNTTLKGCQLEHEEAIGDILNNALEGTGACLVGLKKTSRELPTAAMDSFNSVTELVDQHFATARQCLMGKCDLKEEWNKYGDKINDTIRRIFVSVQSVPKILTEFMNFFICANGPGYNLFVNLAPIYKQIGNCMKDKHVKEITKNN